MQGIFLNVICPTGILMNILCLIALTSRPFRRLSSSVYLSALAVFDSATLLTTLLYQHLLGEFLLCVGSVLFVRTGGSATLLTTLIYQHLSGESFSLHLRFLIPPHSEHCGSGVGATNVVYGSGWGQTRHPTSGFGSSKNPEIWVGFGRVSHIY